MNIKTRTVLIKSGPHYGKREFYYNGKWHFLKWISKRDTLRINIVKENPHA